MKPALEKAIALIAKPAVAVGGSLAIGAALIAYVYVSTAVAPTGVVAKVVQGAITQEVDVTGSVQAAQSTDLAFQTSGRIAAVSVQVGQHVAAGQVLLSLDGASQSAALAGAQANLEAAQAKLASLTAGTRPEQLSIDETNVAQTKQALLDTVRSAYVSADDAVHVKSDLLFTNPRTSYAVLTYPVSDQMLANTVAQERVAIEPIFAPWQSLLSAGTDPLAAAATTTAYLTQTSTFLDDLARALAQTSAGGALTATALAADQAAVDTARSAVAAALGSVTTATTAYRAAEGALTLAQAGATANDIAAEQAAVDAAAAAVQSAKVALGETALIAPVSGTITVQSANPGETVTPGSPLVSMLADGAFEAKALVSEADIGKVKVGDAVSATFDAYPGATFPATVTTVDPAATVVSGVSSYGVTVTFSNRDPRLTSGLSANLRIITATKENVLIVPTSALIQNGPSTFVFVQGAHGAVETQVATGIESADGMTEIVSGIATDTPVFTYGESASF